MSGFQGFDVHFRQWRAVVEKMCAVLIQDICDDSQSADLEFLVAHAEESDEER